MAQSIACPKCRTKLFAPPDVYGQPVRCTKCAFTFKASVAHSPYLEDLPPAPKDRRTLIMVSAVIGCLLLGTGLILGVNWLNDDTRRDGTGMADAKATEKALEKEKSTMSPAFTAKGEPIIVPEDDGPDRSPPPGVDDPLLPKKGTSLTPRKKPITTGDVYLSYVKWDVSPGLRTLRIGYEFQNGASPATSGYTWRFRLDGKDLDPIAIDVTLPPKGEIPFTMDATLGEKSGKQQKIEAWIERSLGTGIGQKVSNTVSTE